MLSQPLELQEDHTSGKRARAIVAVHGPPAPLSLAETMMHSLLIGQKFVGVLC